MQGSSFMRNRGKRRESPSVNGRSAVAPEGQSLSQSLLGGGACFISRNKRCISRKLRVVSEASRQDGRSHGIRRAQQVYAAIGVPAIVRLSSRGEPEVLHRYGT